MYFGEGNGHPLQDSCLENPMDGGAWWAAVHGVAKSRTRLSDSTFSFPFYTLETEMATHSSVLAWRIPGMGEPGGLPSLGSHRVRHDWSNLAAAAAAWYLSEPCQFHRAIVNIQSNNDCNLLRSSVHGTLQARILEWVAMPSSRGSSRPRVRTGVCCVTGEFFTSWAIREALSETTKP